MFHKDELKKLMFRVPDFQFRVKKYSRHLSFPVQG